MAIDTDDTVLHPELAMVVSQFVAVALDPKVTAGTEMAAELSHVMVRAGLFWTRIISKFYQQTNTTDSPSRARNGS